MLITDYDEIVKHRNAPMLVLAGPGLGKTHLLGDRIKYLLDSGVKKDSITVLTYTTDANKEMISRLISSSEPWQIDFVDLPQISTMHSLGLKIIQEKPRQLKLRKTDLKVQDNETIKRLIFRDAGFILGHDDNEAKNAYQCKQYGDCQVDIQKNTCQICIKYWEIMSKCNRVDFDDQILLACQILENNPDVLKEYQTRAQHLLVDEYQDINAAQFRLITLLSKQSRNGLFVVGDDAQSIYAFRGANPHFILNFSDHFPNAKRASLCASWRCPRNIMEHAFTVLDKHYTRPSERPELEYKRGEGEIPLVYKVGNEAAEAKSVTKIVTSAVDQKKDVLILAPKNSIFPPIIKKLTERGIHCDCGINFVPDRFTKVDNYLKWAINPNNNFLTRLVVEELINTGAAKVPGGNKRRLSNPESIRKRVNVEKEIAKLWEHVDKHHSLFSQIQAYEEKHGTVAQVGEILEHLHHAYDNFAECPGKFARELAVASNIWCNPTKLSNDITEVIRLLTPPSTPTVGTIRLRTMRKAKGLQAQVVIIIGLENDMIPGTASGNDLSEQARLFYVSMTRTKQTLYLFHSIRRKRDISYGQECEDKPRSRFLDCLGHDSQWAPHGG